MNKKAMSLAILSAAVLGGTAACAGQTSAPISNTTPNAAVALTVPTKAPTGAPTIAATGAASQSPTTSTPTKVASTAATSSGAAARNPGGYVAGAWLGVGQMPLALAGYTDWQVDSSVGGTRLGAEVFATVPAQSPTGCMDIGLGGLSSLGNGLEGAQIEMFSGSNSDKMRADGVIPAYAHQAVFFYPNAADADAAMNGLAADFATCKNQVTGTDPTTGTKLVGSIQQTADQAGAQCWSVFAIGATSASGPGTLDHDCFVQSGSLIELVNVEVNSVPSLSTQSFTTTDTALIPELQHDLQQY